MSASTKPRKRKFPSFAKPFLLTNGAQFLINRVKREQIVPIETSPIWTCWQGLAEPRPTGSVMAREEFAYCKMRSIICRRAPARPLMLRQIEGLSLREIAQRMDIAREDG